MIAKGPIGGLGYGAMVVVAVVASPAQAQHLATGGGVDVSIVRVVAALCLSLLAGLGLVLLQRRYPGANLPQRVAAALSAIKADGLASRLLAPHRINVIEARRISAHADMCLVRCDAEEYLILNTAGGSTVLRTTLLPGGGDAPQ
jgi:hypothetical protein